jgi:BMFP domain-containing protein YqiC
VQALEARIDHLEQVVQGLQDSVHRESTRLSTRISELEARIQPAALGRALSEDARQRGL